MDLKDQLKNLFPEHKETPEPTIEKSNIWLQDEPIICKYEKRKGKPITILEGILVQQQTLKFWQKKLKPNSL